MGSGKVMSILNFNTLKGNAPISVFYHDELLYSTYYTITNHIRHMFFP
jgi:hypothetical protein